MDTYQKSSLWRSSLGDAGLHESEKSSVTNLLATYMTMRQRASALTSRIATSLPQLTVHDATHLDALWETASLISGASYPLNPMEGFVLGGAILLHDAALCFEAYEGGQDKLRQTVIWRDNYASIRHSQPDATDSDAQSEADFASLRTLHAKQAELLGVKGWKRLDGGETFLIQDDELRKFYGRLIGQIAASHHWSYDDLSRLPEQVNAPGTYPIAWRVDPVKIACLLRCADAAHVDSRRAPDFLYALSRREGISAAHWKAQNWLARADEDLSDPNHETLLITSNHGFSKQDSSAWWVAYDALCLINDELNASSELLSKRPQAKVSPPFALKRVAGASSPEQAKKYLEVVDWAPCSAKIHVGNVERLVRDLGGEHLYGSSQGTLIALRELIQNSRDAIAARKGFDSDFICDINIRLRQRPDGRFIITISDSGIGMSERVLTGPLLDFGTSFWTSSLAQTELPGLRASKFRAAEQFGIGFYSIFMAADSVKVSSRRWNDGHNEIHTLEFPNGLSLRPILSTGLPERFNTNSSTEVQIVLKESDKNPNIQIIRPPAYQREAFTMTLSKCLEAICIGTDVAIRYAEDDEDFALVHPPLDLLTEFDKARDLVTSALLAQTSGNNNASKNDFICQMQRGRSIIFEDRLRGFAALNTKVNLGATYSVITISGFQGTIGTSPSDSFVGFMDMDPPSAARDGLYGDVLKENILNDWAVEQIDLLQKSGVLLDEQYVAMNSLASLGITNEALFVAPVAFCDEIVLMQLNDLLEKIIEAGGLAFYKSLHGGFVDVYHSFKGYGEIPTFMPFSHGTLNMVEEYDGLFANSLSLAARVQNALIGRGKVTRIETLPKAVQGTFSLIDVVILRVD